MNAELKVKHIEIDLETGDVRLLLRKSVGKFELGLHSVAVDALDDLDARLTDTETALATEGFDPLDSNVRARALALRSAVLDAPEVKAATAVRKAEREAKAAEDQRIKEQVEREQRADGSTKAGKDKT